MSATSSSPKKISSTPQAPLPMLVTAPINCCAGMLAWMFCHPMETIKNCITTNYKAPNQRPVTDLSLTWSKTAVMAQHLFHEGGVRRLYRGLGTGQVRQVVYTTSRLSLYDPVEQAFTLGGTRTPTVLDRMLAGGAAGALAGLFSSPVEVALVRVSRTGAQNITLGQMMQQIYQDSGLGGFYRGCGPLMQRTFIVGVAQVGFFKQMMAFMTTLSNNGTIPVSDSRSLVMIASCITGVFYALVTMPLEFARIRMSAQSGKSGADLKYKNSVQTVMTVFREEGIRTIYSVFTPYCGRCLTHTVISFNVIYWMQSYYRKMMGM